MTTHGVVGFVDYTDKVNMLELTSDGFIETINQVMDKVMEYIKENGVGMINSDYLPCIFSYAYYSIGRDELSFPWNEYDEEDLAFKIVIISDDCDNLIGFDIYEREYNNIGLPIETMKKVKEYRI